MPLYQHLYDHAHPNTIVTKPYSSGCGNVFYGKLEASFHIPFYILESCHSLGFQKDLSTNTYMTTRIRTQSLRSLIAQGAATCFMANLRPVFISHFTYLNPATLLDSKKTSLPTLI